MNAQNRFKLLNGEDLAALPPQEWRIHGLLPSTGLAAIYGKSGTGKSFLAFDMAAAIAQGEDWFGYRAKAAPVVYIALEGEAGFRLRAKAWELHHGRKLPSGMRLVLQVFGLTSENDVNVLAPLLPPGAVVIIDTLNRAAPGADENSSRDMGLILQAAKHLQDACKGLVVLIHHSGKDEARGMRGHSSLIAALDAAIEVSRSGDQRKWRLEKSKDGADGIGQAFTLSSKVVDIDEYGDDLESCVVMPDLGVQLVNSAKVPQGGNQKVVMTAARNLLATKAAPITKSMLPAAYPPGKPAIDLEASLPIFASQLKCPPDKRTSRAREALAGLAKRGLLTIADGWIWL